MNLSPFSDLNDHWAKDGIAELQRLELVSGYPDGSFRPEETITRAEFAALVSKVFPDVKKVRQAMVFEDVSPTHWAFEVIRDAYEKQLFSGYPDGTFRPNQQLPRVQGLIVLASALNYAAPANAEEIARLYFDDADRIPSYALGAIAAATENRLPVNYPNLRELRPNRNATRGDVAAFICRALKLTNTILTEYIAGLDFLAVSPEVRIVDGFLDDRAIVQIENQYGYIDFSGATIIPIQFLGANNFAEGLALVRVKNPQNENEQIYGYIDTSGNFAIAPQFQFANSFSEGLARVNIDYKNGFIDKAGQIAIEPQNEFYDPMPFAGGFALVNVSGKNYGYIDKTGQLIGEPRFDFGSSFSEGLAAVKLGDKWGYINSRGDLAIEAKFDRASSFREGLAAVMVGDKWGYIDPQGEIAIAPQFQDARDFSDSLAPIKLDELYGYIDKTGANAVYPRFGLADSFQEGLARVNVGGKSAGGTLRGVGELSYGGQWGYIDTTGKFICEPLFAQASSFQGGFALVNVGGKWIQRNVDSLSFSGGQWHLFRQPQP